MNAQQAPMGHCRHHGSKRNRDLSIKLEHDRIVIHCFAGCEPEDVCASIGLKLCDLFLDNNRSQDDIRRERHARERKRAKAEKEFREMGANLDALREAGNFIRHAKGLTDSRLWSDQKRNEVLDRLGIAYALLEREERGYE